MFFTVARMTLRELLDREGITTLTDFRQKSGLQKQYAWSLWHGKINVGPRLATRLAEALNLRYEEMLLLEHTKPPSDTPPGRPRKNSSPSNPPKPDQPLDE